MFGDFFQRIGNLVTGSGFVSDEEERRKKRLEQQKQQALKAKALAGAPKVLNAAGQQAWLDKQQAPGATPKKSNQPNLSISEQVQNFVNPGGNLPNTPQPAAPPMIARPKVEAKQAPKKIDMNPLVAIPEEVAKATGTVAKGIGKGVQDFITRPAYTFGANIAATAKNQDVKDERKNRTAVGKLFAGDEELMDYRKEAGKIQKGFEDQGIRKDTAAMLAFTGGLGLAALDNPIGSEFRVGVQAIKEGVGNAPRLLKGVVDKVIGDVEQRTGRKLAEEETQKIAEDVEKEALEVAARENPPAPTPSKEKAVEGITPEAPAIQPNVAQQAAFDTQTAAKQMEIDSTYKAEYQKIRNSNLSEQEKVTAAQKLQQDSQQLVEEVTKAGDTMKETTQAAAKQAADEQVARETVVDEAAAARDAAGTPPPDEIVQAPPASPDPEFDANNPYGAVEEDIAANQAVRERNKQNPVIRFLNRASENLRDPRAVMQRNDNAVARAEGVREVDRPRSLARLQGIIDTPNSIVEVKSKQKYGDGYSLDDIIKTYGKDDTPEAQLFERYRLYRDNVERMRLGEENAFAITPEQQAAFIRQYQVDNPVGEAHAKALRQLDLDIVKQATDNGLLRPDVLDSVSQYENYTPRRLTKPEDRNAPSVTGGIRGVAQSKVVQSRTGEIGDQYESPLSMYLNTLRRAEVEQARSLQGRELARRADAGQIGDGEVLVRPENQALHREALATMRDLSERKAGMKELIKASKKDLNAAKQVEAAQVDAVAAVRKYLASMSDTDVFADLAPIADNLTDNEALELFNVMSNVGAKGLSRIEKKLAKDTGITPDEIKEFIQGARNEMGVLKGESRDAWEQFINTNETVPTIDTGNVFTYLENGEQGRVRLPADLGEEFNSEYKRMERDFGASAANFVGNIFKVLFTGVAAPVFKTGNIIKNMGLMFINADGLSGVGFNATKSMLSQIFDPRSAKAFRSGLMERGIVTQNSTMSRKTHELAIQDIAAKAGVQEYLTSRNVVETSKDLWRRLDDITSFVENAQREAVSYGAYRQAIRRGVPEEEAMNIAANAYSDVLGDFQRISGFARKMEPFIMYSGATQAGLRSTTRAFGQRPVETVGKFGALAAAVTGFAAFSVANGTDETDPNNNYYKDMIASGKEYELENSINVVLPGAHKVTEAEAEASNGQLKEGDWVGVIKLPIAPDYRPLNRSIQKAVFEDSQERDIDPVNFGIQVLNFFSGDVANSIYDTDRAEKNWVGGLLPSNPVVNLFKTGLNVDAYTGGNIVSDEMRADKPELADQKFDSTSDAAINLAEKMNISPLQAERVLDQLGFLGDVVQQKKGSNPLEIYVKSVGGMFTGSRGSTEDQEFFKERDALKSEILTDPKQRREWEANNSKTNEPKSLLNTPKKALSYIDYNSENPGVFNTTQQFALDKAIDQRNREKGKVGNPIFDLSPQELQKVLTYRSMKIPNSAKQNYSKGGESAFTSLGLDEKWYQDFKDAEDGFWTAVNKEQGKTDDEIAPTTFSGKAKEIMSDELRATQNQYFALKAAGDKAGAKSLLASNPALTDYWARSEDFTDEERKALGFEIEADDVYSSSGGGYGGGGGGYRPGDENLLNRLGDTPMPTQLKQPTLKQIEELLPVLQRVLAPRSSGGARVPMGGRASGNPRRD